MWIQAKDNKWDKRLKSCKNENEINLLMLNSGTETVSERVILKTREIVFRPAVGKFTIIGIEENDDFVYKNIEEAKNKGVELRNLIKGQINEH